MKTERALSGKRNRARWLVLVGVLSFVVLSFFFIAPVIPVDGSYYVSGRWPCPPTFLYSYTDWQSVGYHLFNIGYHQVSPHTLCQ